MTEVANSSLVLPGKSLKTLGKLIGELPFFILQILGSPIKRPCFLLQDIAPYVGLHYSIVSRIVQGVRKKQNTRPDPLCEKSSSV